MDIIETTIPDVKILESRVFGDERGFFMETFRDSWFRENVADFGFVQENHSRSSFGTLRGLHLQTVRPQGKLVRVVRGEVFDVAVDMRLGSKTLGQWCGCSLSAENKRQIWIPPGFAHGFLVTSREADLVYKCTDYYHPESEVSLSWDDGAVGVEWPKLNLSGFLLSSKDSNGLGFSEVLQLIKEGASGEGYEA